jgi:hypothetical protein
MPAAEPLLLLRAAQDAKQKPVLGVERRIDDRSWVDPVITDDAVARLILAVRTRRRWPAQTGVPVAGESRGIVAGMTLTSPERSCALGPPIRALSGWAGLLVCPADPALSRVRRGRCW